MKDPPRVIRGKVAFNAELAKAERAKQQEPEELMAALLDGLHIFYSRQFRYSNTRKFRADFVLPAGLFLIEIVGGVWQRKAHGSISGILADIDRMNEAAVSGYTMLRFTPDMVKDGTAREVLERLMGRSTRPANEGEAVTVRGGGPPVTRYADCWGR